MAISSCCDTGIGERALPLASSCSIVCCFPFASLDSDINRSFRIRGTHTSMLFSGLTNHIALRYSYEVQWVPAATFGVGGTVSEIVPGLCTSGVLDESEMEM